MAIEKKEENITSQYNAYEALEFIMFPQAIRIGMTPTQFWNEDPQLYWTYLQAYNDAEKYKMEINDMNTYKLSILIKTALHDAVGTIGSKNHKQMFEEIASKMFNYENNQKQEKNANYKFKNNDEYEEYRALNLKLKYGNK